jgi:hypothetical protein
MGGGGVENVGRWETVARCPTGLRVGRKAPANPAPVGLDFAATSTLLVLWCSALTIKG